MLSLSTMLANGPFQGYAYSYPHKSSYRPLSKPRPLQEIWAQEDKRRLFLYLHVPFCEMRCGFCNLFTFANPKEATQQPFLDTLLRQADQVRAALDKATFNRVAIGGGTPSFLGINELERLFDVVHKRMGVGGRAVPFSVELSPKTVNAEKLALLKERGTTRASMGVQSFVLSETKALGRPQKPEEVVRALHLLEDSGLDSVNLDLIYGMAGQTAASWAYSLEQALSIRPEEVFLYPLYVRPLTGLDGRTQDWNDHRQRLYVQGRDFLLERGYEQVTMRLFRCKDVPEAVDLPPYNSPEDGMVGLGVGARSYTRGFHYSSDYAVGRKGVQSIIHHYHEQEATAFGFAHYGVDVSPDEQRRRYVIKSLLEGAFLDFEAYECFFGSRALEDLPQLQELYALNFAAIQPDRLQLNLEGLAWSDVIGPWLYSSAVRAKMEAFELA